MSDLNTKPVYEVTAYRSRAREMVSLDRYFSLAEAVSAFHAKVSPVLHDRDACVFLLRVTGDYSGTVLASKSTGAVHVVFEQAYYSELDRLAKAALPVHTPWGAPSKAPRELAEGIYSYITASHGGIWLSPERNLEVPTALRALRFGSPALDSGFYEEDADWSICVGFFPEAFSEEERVYARKIYEHYVLPKLVAGEGV